MKMRDIRPPFFAVCLLMALSSIALLPASGRADCSVEDQAQGSCGATTPPPIFQRGNRLSEPLADDDPRVQEFLDFYNTTFGLSLPSLSKSDLVALPERYLDLASNGGDPHSSDFNSSLVCQVCHDSDWQVSGQDLPNMTYWSQGHHVQDSPTSKDLAANFSVFGDWSASIKALAGRDPIFLGQVETARRLNSEAAADIDNTCFRCHASTAQRQAAHNGLKFSHYMLYATPEGSGYHNPFPHQTYAGSRYAEYGALARDGVSCSGCHTVGPDSLPWNGQDFTVFYGDPSDPLYHGQAERRIKKHPTDPAFPFPFTASMETKPGRILGPDSNLNAAPMGSVGLTLATATQEGPESEFSFLRQGAVCGSCHVVTLPQIRADYARGAAVPAESAPYYEHPTSCPPGSTFTGEPFTDPCVGLAYEQTTYFEWLNSGYAESDPCQTCHMPTTSAESVVAQVNSDLEPFYGDHTSLTPREFNRHSLLGINLIVHEMYQQFRDVLGIEFYREEGQVVPPAYSSLGVQLLKNPGAESGTIEHWPVINIPPMTVHRSTSSRHPTQSGDFYAHSGEYYFLAKEIRYNQLLSQSVDISRYQHLIDSGNATVTFGGYVAALGGLTPDSHIFRGQDLAVLFFDDGSITPTTVEAKATSTDLSSWTFFSKSTPVLRGTRRLHFNAEAWPGGVYYFDDLFLYVRATPTANPRGYDIAHNLLNAEQSIVELATQYSKGTYGGPSAGVEITRITKQGLDDETLVVDVTVTNNAGHKLPSGAPFRRAFLQVEVLDPFGSVLWASGQPNRYGGICDGPCNGAGSNLLAGESSSHRSDAQPHYKTITEENQVQIYEAKGADENGNLTSRSLSQFAVVKDNRLLPEGWKPAREFHTEDENRLGLSRHVMARITQPSTLLTGSGLPTDPDFCRTGGSCSNGASGRDAITYQIDLSQLASTPTWVRVRMNYQAVPPAYLAARFQDGGDGKATQRVIYMASRLNTDLGLVARPSVDGSFDLMNGWTMVLSQDFKPVPAR